MGSREPKREAGLTHSGGGGSCPLHCGVFYTHTHTHTHSIMHYNSSLSPLHKTNYVQGKSIRTNFFYVNVQNVIPVFHNLVCTQTAQLALGAALMLCNKPHCNTTMGNKRGEGEEEVG